MNTFDFLFITYSLTLQELNDDYFLSHCVDLVHANGNGSCRELELDLTDWLVWPADWKNSGFVANLVEQLYKVGLPYHLEIWVLFLLPKITKKSFRQVFKRLRMCHIRR